MKEAEMEAEIEDFLEGFNQPTYPRHADQWGPGRYLVESVWLEWSLIRTSTLFLPTWFISPWPANDCFNLGAFVRYFGRDRP
jgi:hypothetical protein